LTNLRGFEKMTDLDKSASFLYHAIENIRDIGLSAVDDGTIEARLNAIGNELGVDGELKINQIALTKGFKFFPKYLNETFDDYPEDGTPSTVRSHGQ